MATEQPKLVPSITYFYREPSAMMTITNRLVPQFEGNVHIASIGCATGEEVYTLLALDKGRNRLLVDGFDYNNKSLTAARLGVYTLLGNDFTSYAPDDLAEELFGVQSLPPTLITLAVLERWKEKSRFLYHDIAESPLSTRYPIIISANMLYYYFNLLGEESLRKVLTNIADSLEPGGYLVSEGVNSWPHERNPIYSAVLESHLALTPRYDLVVPYHDISIGSNPARVFQLK